MIAVQDKSQIDGKSTVDVDQSRANDHGLRVVDVRKSFYGPNGDRIEVLRGVMMDVKPGESVAIMGASGSGKSTLLHLLGGLDDANHGSINLGSVEMGRIQQHQLAQFREKRIGFVFQFHYLLNDLTAVENVAMPLLIARRKYGDAIQVAQRMLTEMGLKTRANHLVGQLSGGEQQRVAVARALIKEPLLVLADEPTGNLDAVIGEGIGRAIVDYARRKQNMAVIATHNENVARLCDRVLELRAGCIYSGERSV